MVSRGQNNQSQSCSTLGHLGRDVAVLEDNSTPMLVLTVLFSPALFKGLLGSSIPLKVLLTPRNKFEVTTNEWSMHMNVAYQNLEARSRPRSIHLCSSIGLLSFCSRITPQKKIFRCGIRSGRSTTGVLCFNRRKRLHCRFLRSLKQLRPSSYIFLHWKSVLTCGEQRINFGPCCRYRSVCAAPLDEIVVVCEALGFEFLDLGESWGEVTLPGKEHSQPWTKGFR